MISLSVSKGLPAQVVGFSFAVLLSSNSNMGYLSDVIIIFALAPLTEIFPPAEPAVIWIDYDISIPVIQPKNIITKKYIASAGVLTQ